MFTLSLLLAVAILVGSFVTYDSWWKTSLAGAAAWLLFLLLAALWIFFQQIDTGDPKLLAGAIASQFVWALIVLPGFLLVVVLAQLGRRRIARPAAEPPHKRF